MLHFSLQTMETFSRSCYGVHGQLQWALLVGEQQQLRMVQNRADRSLFRLAQCRAGDSFVCHFFQA